MIKKFRQRLLKEGRSFRWWHKTYLKNISYPYFIIQLNEPERMQEEVEKAIQKYLAEN